MWPLAIAAVFRPTRLCCTRKVLTPGWAPHKIDIPILLCVPGVFLGSTSFINITSPCLARPTTLRTALTAMSQVTCLLSLSCTLCHQYPAFLGHLVSMHDKKILVYVSLCCLRQMLIKKLTPHSMHSKCLSPGCVCICSFKWPFGEQHSLHSLRLNGFSIVSVWIRVYRTKTIQHSILFSFLGSL